MTIRSIGSKSEVVRPGSNVWCIHGCVRKWVWQCTKFLLFFLTFIYTTTFPDPHLGNYGIVCYGKLDNAIHVYTLNRVRKKVSLKLHFK